MKIRFTSLHTENAISSEIINNARTPFYKRKLHNQVRRDRGHTFRNKDNRVISETNDNIENVLQD